jgi:hypothetical protein
VREEGEKAKGKRQKAKGKRMRDESQPSKFEVLFSILRPPSSVLYFCLPLSLPNLSDAISISS